MGGGLLSKGALVDGRRLGPKKPHSLTRARGARSWPLRGSPFRSGALARRVRRWSRGSLRGSRLNTGRSGDRGRQRSVRQPHARSRTPRWGCVILFYRVRRSAITGRSWGFAVKRSPLNRGRVGQQWSGLRPLVVLTRFGSRRRVGGPRSAPSRRSAERLLSAEHRSTTWRRDRREELSRASEATRPRSEARTTRGCWWIGSVADDGKRHLASRREVSREASRARAG